MTNRRNNSKQNLKRNQGNQKVGNSEMSQNEPSAMTETIDVLKVTRETMFNQKAEDDNIQTASITRNTQHTLLQQWGSPQGQFASPQTLMSGQHNVSNLTSPLNTPLDSAYRNMQLSSIQQPIPYANNGMPPWAASMCQQLNNIQCTLENQNRRWQSMEEKLQTQNATMSSIESKLVNLPVLEQNINKANKNIELTQNEMRSIKQKVTEYDNTIQQYSNICDDMITNNTSIGQQVNEVLKKVKRIEINQEKMQKTQVEAQDKIVDLQWRSMRENLVISGIPENDREENCEGLICDFIKTKLDIQEDIKFDRVHRLGRFDQNRRHPRPIVAKFTNFKDKEKVKLAAPNKLKNTNIYVNDQYPQEIEQKRKQLYPIAREARRNPKNKVKLIKDRLYVNGIQHSAPHQTNEYSGQTVRTTDIENGHEPQTRETNTRRKYTRRYENTGTGVYFTRNRFSELEPISDDVLGTPRPAISGKKKAVSPLDSDVASKKIKDTNSDDDNSSECSGEVMSDVEDTHVSVDIEHHSQEHSNNVSAVTPHASTD